MTERFVAGYGGLPIEPAAITFGAIVAEGAALLRRHRALMLAGWAALAAADLVDAVVLRDGFWLSFMTNLAVWLVLIPLIEGADGRNQAVRGFGAVALSYIGASIMVGLGALIGLLLFVIPGIYWASCWIITSQLVILRGLGASDAMSESWRLTRSSRGAIISAMLVALAGWIGVAAAGAALRDVPSVDWAGMFDLADAAVGATFGIVQLLLAQSCYRLLLPSDDGYSEIFG